MEKIMKHIPNLLSMARILMIPWIVTTYLEATELSHYLWAGMLLTLSGITDIADGYIARKYQFITPLGKALDPLADKLTQVAVAIALSLRSGALWPLPAFLAVKELVMGACGLWVYRKYKVVGAARWYGKLATIIFYGVAVVLMACPPLWDGPAVWMLLSLVGLAMVFSGVRYAVDFRRSLAARREQKSTCL